MGERMAYAKYRTVGRKDHRHGRLSCLCDVNVASRKLHVAVLEARGLTTGLSSVEAKDVYISIRVQLLPSQNGMMVRQSLLDESSSIQNFKRHTHTHKFSPNPKFEEEFTIDLNDVWPIMDQFRLYICAVASEPVASDGSGFLGMTSFSFEDMVSQAAQGGADGKRLLWWWLFSQEMGLHRSMPVEMMIVNSDPRTAEPDIAIGGRADHLANYKVNGVYTWQSDLWNGRPTYRHTTPGRDLYLYFNARAGIAGWGVGDYIGSTDFYAFCESSSSTPDKARGTWAVLGVQREYDPVVAHSRGQPYLPEGSGRLMPDFAVKCAQTALLQLVQPGTGTGGGIKSLRAAKVLALVASTAELDQTLSKALEASKLLLHAMDEPTHRLIFSGLREVGLANVNFLDSLMQAQSTDQNFSQPVTALLSTALRGLSAPYVTFCKGLAQKVEVLKDRLSNDPHCRKALPQPDAEALVADMEAPLKQVQLYPRLVEAIIKASKVDRSIGAQQDAIALMEPWNGFKLLSTAVLESAARGAAASASSPERRSNAVQLEASQPIGNPMEVRLERDAGGYGFATAALPTGMYVKSVKKRGPAARGGQLIEGMKVLLLNGVAASKMSPTTLQDQLTRSPVLVLTVQYDPIGFEAGVASKEPWFHGIIDVTTAENRLAGTAPGSFLVRQCPEKARRFSLVVASSGLGAFSHHEMRREPDGIMAVDGLSVPFFAAPYSLAEAIEKITSVTAAEWAGPSLGQLVDRSSATASTAPTEPLPDIPMGASADVTITKEPQSKLGLVLKGPKPGQPLKGCYVKKVTAGSPSAAVPELHPGVRVLAVFGQNVEHMTEKAVNSLLKENAGKPQLQLTVAYDPLGYAVYDGGALVKTEASLRKDKPPAASAPAGGGDDGGDLYGQVQGFGDGAGPAGAQHHKVDDLYLPQDGTKAAAAPVVTVAIESPLGISFDGDATVGSFVTKVKKDSNAEKVGGVAVGQQIVSIDGASCAGKDRKELTVMIKASPGPVLLGLQVNEAAYKAYSEIKAARGGGPMPVNRGGGATTGEKPKEAGAAPAEKKGGSEEGKPKKKKKKKTEGDGADGAEKKKPKKKLTLSIPLPMGMSFDGTPEYGSWVTKVRPGSNAEKFPAIKAGLRIVSINETPCKGLPKKDVTALVKQTAGSECKVEFKSDAEGFAAFQAFKKGAAGSAPDPPARAPASGSAPKSPPHATSGPEPGKPKKKKKASAKGGKSKFKKSDWFVGKAPRVAVENLIMGGKIGDFVVRESERKSGAYVMVQKIPPSGNVLQTRVVQDEGGWGLDRKPNRWPSLEALVEAQPTAVYAVAAKLS